MTKDSKVQAVYAAQTPEAQRAAYDDWAQSYEQELMAMGYRIPAIAAGLFGRYVPKDSTPILDAGCGGGLQAEPLALMGYRHLTGLDLSQGMLDIAASKGIYDTLVQHPLGGGLPFDKNHFAATISCGTITQGHAPPSSFADLIHVTRPGGLIIFTLRDDPGIDPAYQAAVTQHKDAGDWRVLEVTEATATMPYGEPEGSASRLGDGGAYSIDLMASCVLALVFNPSLERRQRISSRFWANSSSIKC